MNAVYCSRYVQWVANMGQAPVDQSLISWFWLVRLFCTIVHDFIRPTQNCWCWQFCTKCRMFFSRHRFVLQFSRQNLATNLGSVLSTKLPVTFNDSRKRWFCTLKILNFSKWIHFYAENMTKHSRNNRYCLEVEKKSLAKTTNRHDVRLICSLSVFRCQEYLCPN